MLLFGSDTYEVLFGEQVDAGNEHNPFLQRIYQAPFHQAGILKSRFFKILFRTFRCALQTESPYQFVLCAAPHVLSILFRYKNCKIS